MAKGKVISAAVAASLAISVPVIGKWEGKSNDPYKDIAGITTVCYGETRAEMKRYTDEECKTMLEDAVVEFAEPVLQMTPTLETKPYALAAVTSLSYNIGLTAYKGSTARKKFLRGDILGGCTAMLNWNKARVRGKLVTVRGLANRRMDEYRLCIKDI